MEIINEIINNIKGINKETIINIIIAIIIVAIFKIISSFVATLIIKIFKKNEKSVKTNSFYKPLKTIVLLIGIYMALIFLKVPENIHDIAVKIFKIITIILLAIGSAGSVKEDSKWILRIKERANIEDRKVNFNFLSKVIKILIYILAGFLVITELGYNINGLITGLGLGSVVIALAAQDTAKNLFGGFVILFDKAFKVGDWIETKEAEGIVEDITFRSTRIRTFEDSIIIVPNSVLSSISIINWSEMSNRRYKLDLSIDINTPLQKMEEVKNKIYKTLANLETVNKELLEVTFNRINDNSYTLMLYVFTSAKELYSYLEFRDIVNFKVMQILKDEDVQLSCNSQKTYLEK